MTFYAIECMNSAQDTHYLRTKGGAWKAYADQDKARRVVAQLQAASRGTAAYRLAPLEVDNRELAAAILGPGPI